MKKARACKHYWSYEHTLWQGRSANEVLVGRYCSNCGLQQMARAKEWGPIGPSQVDMRATLRNKSR